MFGPHFFRPLPGWNAQATIRLRLTPLDARNGLSEIQFLLKRCHLRFKLDDSIFQFRDGHNFPRKCPCMVI